MKSKGKFIFFLLLSEKQRGQWGKGLWGILVLLESHFWGIYEEIKFLIILRSSLYSLIQFCIRKTFKITCVRKISWNTIWLCSLQYATKIELWIIFLYCKWNAFYFTSHLKSVSFCTGVWLHYTQAQIPLLFLSLKATCLEGSSSSWDLEKDLQQVSRTKYLPVSIKKAWNG